MKFYIATGFDNKVGHNAVRDELTAAGHTLTYDWTVPNSPPSEDSGLMASWLGGIGQKEINGVLSADVLVVLHPGGIGTHAELGMALAKKIPVLMLSIRGISVFPVKYGNCPFYYVAGIYHVDEESAMGHLDNDLREAFNMWADERSWEAAG